MTDQVRDAVLLGVVLGMGVAVLIAAMCQVGAWLWREAWRA